MSRNLRINRNLGMLLLAIWLILTGLIYFVPALAPLTPLLAILAIVAGIVILFVGI